LAAALSLLAWWTRALALRPDTETYYVELVVLLLALLAFDAAIHPTARPGVCSSRRSEELAVLINALALTFLAGSIAYTASQHLASPATDARLPGIAIALLTLMINGTLVMGRQPAGRATGHVRAVVVDMLRRVVRSVPVLVASIAVLLTQAPPASPTLAFPITGFIAWVMWRAVYLAKMPEFTRKVRVMIDWMLEPLLPTDIVQIRIEAGPAVERARPDDAPTPPGGPVTTSEK